MGTETAPPVDAHHGLCGPRKAGRRPGHDQSPPDPLGDHWQTLYAVGRATAQVRFDQRPRLVAGLFGPRAERAQHVDDQRALVRGVDRGELRFVHAESPLDHSDRGPH